MKESDFFFVKPTKDASENTSSKLKSDYIRDAVYNESTASQPKIKR